jgi:hypothetical protein
LFIALQISVFKVEKWFVLRHFKKSYPHYWLYRFTPRPASLSVRFGSPFPSFSQTPTQSPF